MDTLFKILESNLLVGFILLVVVVPLYWRMGFFKKNGNGKNEVLEAIQGLKSNDLHELPEIVRSLSRIELSINRGFERTEDKLDKLSEKVK